VLLVAHIDVLPRAEGAGASHHHTPAHSYRFMVTPRRPRRRLPADEESEPGHLLVRKPNEYAVAPFQASRGCAHLELAHLFWRITNPAPRTVCSKSCAKPLSIFDRRREMCTSMTLVCGSK
jgi:hypothetical protein